MIDIPDILKCSCCLLEIIKVDIVCIIFLNDWLKSIIFFSIKINLHTNTTSSPFNLFPELHQHSNISFYFKYACIVHVYAVIYCYDSSWSFRVHVFLLFVYICSTVVDTGINGGVEELGFRSNSTSLRKR